MWVLSVSAEVCAQILCTCLITLKLAEVLALVDRKTCGHDMHHCLGQLLIAELLFIEIAECKSETDISTEAQKFLGAHQIRGAQGTERTVRKVGESVGAVGLHGGSCITLKLHYLCRDLLELLYRIELAYTERCLIGYLIHVAVGIRALAPCAADSESELSERGGKCAYLAVHSKCGEKYHYRGSHAGTEIGGTMRQESELVVKRNIETVDQLIIDLVCAVECLLECRPERIHCRRM